MGSASFTPGANAPVQPPLLSFVPSKGAKNGAFMVYSGKGSRLQSTMPESIAARTTHTIQDDQKSIISSTSNATRAFQPMQVEASPIITMRPPQSQTGFYYPMNVPGKVPVQVNTWQSNPPMTVQSTNYAPSIRTISSQTALNSSRNAVAGTQNIRSQVSVPHQPYNQNVNHSQPLRKQSAPELRGRSRQASQTTSRGLSPQSVRSAPSGRQALRNLSNSTSTTRTKRVNSDAAYVQSQQQTQPVPTIRVSPTSQVRAGLSTRLQPVVEHNAEPKGATSKPTTAGRANWRPVFGHAPPPPPKPAKEDRRENSKSSTEYVNTQTTQEVPTPAQMTESSEGENVSRLRPSDQWNAWNSGEELDKSKQRESCSSINESCAICLLIDMYSSSSTECLVN